MIPAIGNIIYTIYPVNSIFTASYSSGTADSFTFTNEDCTVVNDHLTYTSPEVNVIGTTTFTAYGKTYTVDTGDGACTPTVYINIPPEHLYAYTDTNAKTETLYAWTNTQYNATIYTNTLYPVTSGPFYNSEGIDITIYLVNGDCGINSISSSSITWGVGGKGWTIPTTTTEVPMGEYIYDRDSSKDIVGNPSTVYTDSTTLTNGMTLYDNTGTDTGYVVGNISNNSFDRCVMLSFEIGTNVTSYTINGTTYNSNMSIPVLIDESNTLSITSSSTITGGLCINNNSFGLTASCTFTINGSSVTFISGNYSYTDTINTTFILSYGGGSIN